MRKPAFGDRAPGSRCPLRRAESTVAGCNYASSSSSGIISRESAEAQVAKSAVHERTERLTGGIGVLEELGYALPRRLTRAPPGKQAPGAGRAEAVDQMVTEVLGQDLGVVLPDRPVQPGQRQQHIVAGPPDWSGWKVRRVLMPGAHPQVSTISPPREVAGSMMLRRLCRDLPAICQQPGLTSLRTALCRFDAIHVLTSPDGRRRVGTR